MKLPLLYLITGDRFLIEGKVEGLVKKIKSHIQDEVHIQKYSLCDDSIDQVLAQARNLPFLAQAQIFLCSGSESLKEKHMEVLESYCNNPSKTTYLVFLSEDIDMRSAFFKLVKHKGEVIAAEERDKPSELRRLIKSRFQSAGKKVSPQALHALIEQGGEMPMVMDTLIDQLILYSGTKEEIDKSMVEQFEETWEQTDVFQLTNAIAAKKTGEAMMLLKRLLSEKQELMSLIGFLHWQIKRLWQAKVLLEEGCPEREALKRCRVSDRQAPYFLKPLRLFSRNDLDLALDQLFQLDWKTKTGRAIGEIELEKWLVELTA